MKLVFSLLILLLILAGAMIGLAIYLFENTYRKDVLAAVQSSQNNKEILQETDIQHLPLPVQNYLRYVGALGKPKVHNFKITFAGQMRDKGKDWFEFTSEQYNFIEHPTRLFFMKAKVKGLAVVGYHSYKDHRAKMLIKALSLIPVVSIDSPELFPTETVTFFNDLCLFAPSALIDDRIKWEAMDSLSAKASFTTDDTTISAILQFNEQGQLVNFISDDRYSVSEMKRFTFSTPAGDYREINGYRLPTYGKAIWHYPDGKFVYGKFYLQSLDYNVEHLIP